MPTKPTSSPKPRASASPNAIKLLTEDHSEVHALFQKYDKLAQKHAAGDTRQALAEQICLLLTVHATIEEEIFYPAARQAKVDAALLDEAEVEHATCKDLIDHIRAMSPSDALYDAKVKVLGEYISHHAKEEQDEMFPKCRESEMDLKAIGAALQARKVDLMAEMTEGMAAA